MSIVGRASGASHTWSICAPSTQTVQILRATETKQETLDGEILEQLIERSVRLAREIE
jgi:hypothetical protein